MKYHILGPVVEVEAFWWIFLFRASSVRPRFFYTNASETLFLYASVLETLLLYVSASKTLLFYAKEFNASNPNPNLRL